MTRVQSHRTRILFSIVVIFFGFIVSEAEADELSVRSFLGQPSLRVDPVTFEMGRVQFNVPRNYLESITLSPVTHKVMFSIVASLPNFEGATANTISCFKSQNWYGCPDVVVLRPRAVSNYMREKLFASMPHPLPSKDAFGLIRLAPKFDVAPGEYYVSSDNEIDSPIIIRCTLSSEPLQYCMGFYDIGQEMEVAYQFLKPRLADWQAISNGVAKLVSKFRTGITQ